MGRESRTAKVISSRTWIRLTLHHTATTWFIIIFSYWALFHRRQPYAIRGRESEIGHQGSTLQVSRSEKISSRTIGTRDCLADCSCHLRPAAERSDLNTKIFNNITSCMYSDSRYTCLRYKSTYNLFYFSVFDWLNTPGLISRQQFLGYIIVVGIIKVNGSIYEVCCAELLQWNFLFWPTRVVLHCTVLCFVVLYLYEEILSETIAWYQYVLQTDLNNIAICKFVMQRFRRLKQVLFR